MGNSNNFFGRQRRLAIEKVLAGLKRGQSMKKRQLLEEILTEVEEEELSGERKQPSLEFIGSSSGVENPLRVHDLLQQIVEKLNQLSSELASSSRSPLPTFPAGTKFYSSDGRGGLAAIRAPVTSVPVDNDPVRKTEGISELLDYLTEQERREITKLLLKK